jgi:sensor c-di-GMP phosphodiesterase-like protein
MVTLLGAIVAIAVPITISVLVAYREAREGEFNRALAYAHDVVFRSEKTADQIDAGIKRLIAAGAGDPCSAERLNLMRSINLTSSYIHAIGHIVGNVMVCSSLGGDLNKLDLGPTDEVSPAGVKLRNNVQLAFAPGNTFVVVERDGYAAIVNKDLPIDVTTDVKGVALGTLSLRDQKILSARGNVKAQWMNAAQGKQEATFVEDGYVVGVVASSRYFIGAAAAVPIDHLNARALRAALVLVPVGLAAGLALAWAVLYLARQRLGLPSLLKLALKRNEFFLVYQPIVELRHGRCVGAEALLRWRRPDGEFVRPDLFVPVAEEEGLIHDITKRVMQIVAQDASVLLQQRPDLHIGINLSSKDLEMEETGHLVRDLILQMGVQPHNILVEATERGFMRADVVRRIMSDIRSLDVKIAIDDFGTGYSSLSYLEKFELDFLKIDKSFVDTMGGEAATSQVAVHIIEMAKSLKLEMIAEGVETPEQAQFLRERGVQFAQGYFFAKPMSIREFASFVNQTEKLAA